MTDEKVRLPRVTEPGPEYFALATSSIEQYSVPPRTLEELYAHTSTSMMAIGIVMSLHTKQRLAEQGAAAHVSDAVLFGDASGQGTTLAGQVTTTGGVVVDRVLEHKVDDYGDYYSFPLPVSGLVGQYTERKDESGNVHGVVQIQPPMRVPDLPADATFTEIAAALERAQAQDQQNAEYMWDSTEPDVVRINRGPDRTELIRLTPEELLDAVRLLRHVAIMTAAVTNHQTVLERLLPPEHEVSRAVAPRAVARALQTHEQLFGPRRGIEAGMLGEVVGDEEANTERTEQ